MSLRQRGGDASFELWLTVATEGIDGKLKHRTSRVWNWWLVVSRWNG